MKCCFCNKEMPEGYFGNNPYPLCNRDDNESRCCDDCNDFVIRARLIQAQNAGKTAKVGDILIIFSAQHSNKPIEHLIQNGKFLGGKIEEIITHNNKINYVGIWGDFVIVEDDEFAII